MKSTLFALCFLLSFTTLFGQSDFYSRKWSNVYRYEIKDLPKSALAVVDSIYRKAKAEKNIQEFTRALLYQSKFMMDLEEDAELHIVQKLKQEIAVSQGMQRNILESILANVHWDYFQRYRWKYYGRTKTTAPVDTSDFRTWDNTSTFSEIHKHFQNSLRSADELKNVKIGTLSGLLVQAEKSAVYRPTVFDLLMHNAIDFYSSADANIAASMDSLANAQTFKLYETLLNFHSVRKDTNAIVGIELERETFKSRDQPMSLTHYETLAGLKRIYAHHPASTLIDFEIANLLDNDVDASRRSTVKQVPSQKAKALEICDQALRAFPNSDGALKCKALRENILRPQIELTVEQYVPIQKPSRLRVEYTNVDSVYLSAFRVSEEFQKSFERIYYDSLQELAIKDLSAVVSWSVTLKQANDYNSHSTEVVVPALSQGRYLLLSRISKSGALFAFEFVQITDLVVINSADKDRHRYQVVDRNTGRPIPEADVHLKSLYGNSRNDSIDVHLKTDRNGFCEWRTETYWHLAMNVRHGNDEATFGNVYLYGSRDYSENKSGYTAKSFLFTDRSIYRPGQTVYFKGILIKTAKNKSTVVSGEYIHVRLDDVNAQEVASMRLKTNAYGSFSGEFKLPASGLTGEYTLYAEEDEESDSKFYENSDDFYPEEAIISVEEYKRPTFEVSFNPITEAFKLYDSIAVKGTAVSFSGAKISRAKVNYRVTRVVRYPRWFERTSFYEFSSEKEISHGEEMTDAEGEFTIKFAALPDELISPDGKPVFEYEITADVVDISGETRSATTTTKAGYHSIEVTMAGAPFVDRKSTAKTITITSQNLNGQYVPSKGSVRIYKLTSPQAPVRKRPWVFPDLPLMSEQEFKAIFPHDPYRDEDDSKKWPKGKLVFDQAFDTEKSKEVKFTINATWESGSYSVELNSSEPIGGEPVYDQYNFKLAEKSNQEIADQQLLVFETDKPSYVVGDVAKLKVGSASADITLTIDIEHHQKVVKTFVEHFSGTLRDFSIPITESMGGGFTVRCTGVNYNAPLSEVRTMQIVPKRERLEIETITFKDKLQPGAKETWSFTIKGDDSEPKQAEVLASMYDASLDQFKPHAWSFNPAEPEIYYPYSQPHTGQSFGISNFTVVHRYDLLPMPSQYFDTFDWFGFSISREYSVRAEYMERLFYMQASRNSKITMRNSKDIGSGLIAGTLRDSEGLPLAAATVLIKGTDLGMVTDSLGHYQVIATKGDVLVFSFIGYKTTEVKVGRKNIIDVTMVEDAVVLAEVSITSYGVQKKSLLTGAATVVVTQEGVGEVYFEDVDADSTAADGFTSRRYRLAESSLAGKAEGVQITGRPGGDARLMIRGNSSVAGDAMPLYVVDGVVVGSYKIDQSDLGDVQVLKGIAATALYGARAANGVIIVTTKSGQKKLDEEMAKLTARKNFNETAFFFPHLRTDESGKINFTFTTPEALTRWKLQLLAHTKNLVTASTTLQAVTQKELMVTPNAPRFMRVGDEIVFSAKISNLSAKAKEGKAALQLTDAVTGAPVDAQFANVTRTLPFKIGAKGNANVSWKLRIPEGVEALQYKIVAKAGNFSDGEQNALPILANRTLVTETLPMNVRAGQTKTFRLEKLISTNSSTLQHHQFTLEITSNPAWYALQALPYLMEFPHECAEQIFSRYYSNALASHVVNSNSKIKAVFDQWSSSGELISNLEKNPELKSIIIEETPWLRDAQSETEQKKRIAVLFDLNTMKDQLRAAITKLEDMQFDNGGFPWFSGGNQPSRFITQHVASGFGHLKHLNVPLSEDVKPVVEKAVAFLDREIYNDYNEILTQAARIKAQTKDPQEAEKQVKLFMDQQHVSADEVQYLYMRSFYPDIVVGDVVKPAIEYYTNQSFKFWKDFNLYSRAMIALIQHREKNARGAGEILASLKENSIVSEEMGMYWKENKAGWYWYESPVETQALLIEAFAEIGAPNSEKQKTLDELRLWLLKNKQTNQWKTTKATTEAVYALLLQGTDWLSVANEVDVTVGGAKVSIDNKKPEVGTGYFKTSWKAEAVKPSLGEVTLTKKGEGIAWGGMYWQYFEDLDKITSAETPLKLSKKVFLVNRTSDGEVLAEVNAAQGLKVGDLLRVRIELRADRPMEFLHMKDLRAAGLEPVDVLSEYKWQEGLGYYQSTKDAATHFFFDSVPQGIYVFEYDLRVNNSGNFSNGITTIQSMYAPEFNSHSEGTRIRVD